MCRSGDRVVADPHTRDVTSRYGRGSRIETLLTVAMLYSSLQGNTTERVRRLGLFTAQERSTNLEERTVDRTLIDIRQDESLSDLEQDESVWARRIASGCRAPRRLR